MRFFIVKIFIINFFSFSSLKNTFKLFYLLKNIKLVTILQKLLRINNSLTLIEKK